MNKRIIVSGATGMIGKKLTSELNKRGYELVIITRNVDEAKYIIPYSNQYLKLDSNLQSNLKELIDNNTIIINLAGASLAAKRWSKQYKNTIYNSRINITNTLAQALINSTKPAQAFISMSAVGFYGDCGELEVDENSKNGNDFLAKICLDWENAANQALNYTNTIIIRTGVVFNKTEGAFPKLIMPAKFGFGAYFGSGMQWFPWIYIDDLINIIIWCIDNPKINGAFNAVAPNSIRLKDLIQIINQEIDNKIIIPIPKLFLSLILSEAASMLLASQRVSAKKIINTGFSFEFGSLNIALKDLINNNRTY